MLSTGMETSTELLEGSALSKGYLSGDIIKATIEVLTPRCLMLKIIEECTGSILKVSACATRPSRAEQYSQDEFGCFHFLNF